ncbi:DUF1318 domain-containing protein [Hahella sp. KA22]|uniref:YdbL family protein n=1 Tax=unclassified Hahella TaxID=2624107 RepID=UPI000FDEE935|nr:MULTISPECIES: YdbL family protein [unclassified Hahella]AZZ90576.1 DUF1318 domain-containing protein [Hahella sp. KA22]MDG9670780.1 YdbL family protein [Hahella sp. CR1]QAY53946.1 DUF1318 domain-containing protein [Hahella sp. KA22]
MKKIILALFCSLFVSMPAWALDLDEAKAKGLVGEQADGYLGAVKSGAEVNALVSETNDKRSKKYAKIAAERGISVDEVGKLAGKLLIEKAGPKDYVKGSGGWVMKEKL